MSQERQQLTAVEGPSNVTAFSLACSAVRPSAAAALSFFVSDTNGFAYWLRRVCSQCGSEFGRTPCAQAEHNNITHGFCPACGPAHYALFTDAAAMARKNSQSAIDDSRKQFASGGVESPRPLTNGHQQSQTPSLRVTKAEAPKSDSRHTGTESGSIAAGVASGTLAESFSVASESKDANTAIGTLVECATPHANGHKGARHEHKTDGRGEFNLQEGTC